jgi:signal transduction histidine kinase/PAS domain-containing protein
MLDLPSALPTDSSFFVHILNTAHMGIATLQPIKDENQVIIDFTVTYVNDSARNILGYVCNRDMEEADSFTVLFPNARKTGFLDIMIHVFQTGKTYTNPELAYRRSGRTSWYDIQVSRYEQTLAAMIIDVSGRKQAQLAYGRQVEFLDGLLTSSTSGIIAYDAVRAPHSDPNLPLSQAYEQGHIQDFSAVFFNEAFPHIVNEPAEQIRARLLSERISPATFSELMPYFAELMKSGRSLKHERYFPHLGKWLAVSGTGLPNGFSLILDDISARKEAESVQQYQAQELQSLNQELLRSNENLLEFSYVASHDLQEPLRKIRQFGSILEETHGEHLGEQGLGLLSRMQSAADRMSTLIRDLLDYSRLSRQSSITHNLDLNELLGGVLTALELEIADKKAVVTVEPLGRLSGNATQLAQAFQNLVSNALKFAKPGQPPYITIRSQTVGVHELPEEFLPSASEVSYCSIQVSDNGIGFEPAQAERIFGAFQRLHSKSAYPGTGIGLAIVKKVVENHCGFITAHSKPGDGASFMLYLPTVQREPIATGPLPISS